jgi:hypothetical protein
MADELTNRRNRKTMEGVVCAASSGPLEQGDYDAVSQFKRYLQAMGEIPPEKRDAERARIYAEHYPDDAGRQS